MEELRVAFLVIGSIFILGVLVHGIWKMRRQDGVPERITESSDNKQEPLYSKHGVSKSTSRSESSGFDELGIGSVRVVAKANKTDDERHIQGAFNRSEESSVDSALPSDGDLNSNNNVEESLEQQTIDNKQEPEPLMYASVITQPKPHMNEPNQVKASQSSAADIPSPPIFLLKDGPEPKRPELQNAEPDFDLTASPAGDDLQKNLQTEESTKFTKKRASIRKRKEPTLGKDQIRIDFDEPVLREPISTTNNAPASVSATEVLVINVRASDDNLLSGASLLPMLLTLGFKFGEQDIFHRHVNTNGTGPVLFSLANMVKPGIFDIDNLETFTTLGISLFMVLPIEGEPHQVFNMMHNAARKIAEEFDAQLLDGRRSILTKQGIQQYVEKIREFERQRIISNSTR